MNEKDEQQLEVAIDLVARRMLDAEPPAGFRDRVLDRLGPRRRPTWLWVAAAAAAAVLLFVVLRPLSTNAPPVRAGIDHVQPLPAVKPIQAPTPHPQVLASARPSQLPRVQPRRGGTANDVPDQEDASVVAPLAAPASIAVADIDTGASRRPGSLAVRPIEIPALDVSALTEAPEDRREE